MNIVFTDTLSSIDPDFYPKPTTSCIPDWYKEAESYTEGKKQPVGNGRTTATVKRCMPVFDALTTGYIIPTYVDIFVSKKPEIVNNELKIVPWYEWPSLNAITFHPVEQAPTYPGSTGIPYPKFMNPWSIKTPPGYSTLFLPPVHRDNPFSILPGIVDTDLYTVPVHFPMTLTNSDFEGLIPAGTPLVQVIPFKRESWKLQFGSTKEIEEQKKVGEKTDTKFFDRYKTFFRQSKEFK